MSFSIETIVARNLREHEKLRGNLRPFTLFWMNGQREVVFGHTAADAMSGAGYSSGALAALDFWKAGDSFEYFWSSDAQKWVHSPQP